MAMDDLVGQRDCRPLVYIASPYAKGDQIRNVRASLDVFNRLLEDGVVIPVAPLLACLVHPRSVEEWMAYDLALLARCDAVLARDARHGQYVQVESAGRDAEVAFAEAHGIPVFWSIDRLYKRFRGTCGDCVHWCEQGHNYEGHCADMDGAVHRDSWGCGRWARRGEQ
jgi:hypothetical protein